MAYKRHESLQACRCRTFPLLVEREKAQAGALRIEAAEIEEFQEPLHNVVIRFSPIEAEMVEPLFRSLQELDGRDLCHGIPKEQSAYPI